MFGAIKSFFTSSFAKILIKIGLSAYEEKNDNEITSTIVDAVEDELDIDSK